MISSNAISTVSSHGFITGDAAYFLGLINNTRDGQRYYVENLSSNILRLYADSSRTQVVSVDILKPYAGLAKLIPRERRPNIFTYAASGNSADGSGDIPFFYELTVTTSVANINVYNFATSAGWDGEQVLDAKIYVATGAYVSSFSTSVAAVNTQSSFPTGTTITLINSGIIAGRGGQGGLVQTANGANGNPGGRGGPAIDATGWPLTIYNFGTIGGGGGGGGAGGNDSTTLGGGGGGGAGIGAGSGGNNPGNAGTINAGGAGGAGDVVSNVKTGVVTARGGNGGTGGWLGQGGGGGGGALDGNPGAAGGLPGTLSVTGSAVNITWAEIGTRHGLIV